MSTRERPIDRGRLRAAYIRQLIGRELRETRIAAGLSQDGLGAAVGLSGSQVGRIEHGTIVAVSIERLATLSAALGCELSVRTYPIGSPLRDAGHVRIQVRFKGRIGQAWRWLGEVLVTAPPDPRAWDAVISTSDVSVGVEFETRMHDLQALLRRLAAKRHAGRVMRMILVVADTRANREAVEAGRELLATAFPGAPAVVWAALRAGRDPGADALLFV